jgi:hypothetical protein
MSQLGMLHMSTLGINFYRLSVQIEYTVDDLGLPETYSLGDLINDISFCILKCHLKVIKVRRFCSPLLWSKHLGRKTTL